LLAPSEYEGIRTAGYLDSATYGLPPRSTLAALERAVEGWREWEDWHRWEEDGEACRALFARLAGARPEDIALLPALSAAAGIVAMSLPAGPGDNVVLFEREFHSALLPWMALESRGVEMRFRPLEYLVDRSENPAHGAERKRQFLATKRQIGVQRALGEFASHRVEARRIGALETENRLFLVADREDGAATVLAGAAPREELFRKLLDHGPLLGARILCLVDQEVIDAAVELVVHPGCGRIGQEIGGLADQIAEIEPSALGLHRLVATDDGSGERE